MKVDRCLLKSYPDGPLAPSDFEFESKDMDFTSEMKDGSILIKLLDISVDPYMRALMKEGPGYLGDGFKLGKPLISGCVAEVVESKHTDYPVGTLLTGFLPWETYQVLSDPAAGGVQKLPKLEGIPTSYFLGALGLTGLSAYFPFKHYAKDHLLEQEKKHDSGGTVVFVSGAAGAVGSVFGQLCKTQLGNCKVYGSAGSPEKIDLCKNVFHFDDAFNYKDDPNMSIGQKLDSILKGQEIDVYFDNVGGEMLDEVLLRMKRGGKVICCGSISDYDKKSADKYGIKNIFSVTSKCLTLYGFLLHQFADEFPQGSAELGKLIAEKKLISQETVLRGFDKLPEGMIGLFGAATDFVNPQNSHMGRFLGSQPMCVFFFQCQHKRYGVSVASHKQLVSIGAMSLRRPDTVPSKLASVLVDVFFSLFQIQLAIIFLFLFAAGLLSLPSSG